MADEKPSGLRGWVQTRLRAGAESLFGVTFTHSTSNPIGDAWKRGLDGILGGKTELDRPYAQHPVIHQAISTVAADAASIEWQAFPSNGTPKQQETEVPEHPVLEFLEHDIKGFTFKQAIEATVVYILLDGEVFWYYPDAIINPINVPDAARLQGGEMMIVPTAAIDWTTSTDGAVPMPVWRHNRQPLDPTKLTRFSRFNPYGSRGLSAVTPFYTDARADLGAAKWNEYMLAERNGLPNLVLLPPNEGGGTPQQRKEVKEKWESAFAKGRAGVGVTPPGWDLKELGGSRKDMEFGALRSGARETILAGIGLVPFLAGVLDKANYANAREQKSVYWRGTIARLLSMLEDVINHDFLPKIGVEDVELYPQWEVIRAMADDVEQKTRIATQWFALGVSKRVINESLEMGWNPDNIEDYDVGYLNSGLIPSDMAGDVPDPVVVAPPADPNAPPDDPNAPKPPPPNKPPPPKAGLTAAQNQDRKHNLHRLGLMRLKVLERPAASFLRSWMQGLEQQVLDRLRSISGLRVVTTGDVAALENVMFDAVKANQDLIAGIVPKIRAALVTGGASIMVDASLNIRFNPDDLRLAAKLVAQQMKVVNITPTIRDHLNETLAEGLSKGESMTQMADRVMATFDASKQRAQTIARTEMGIAYSNGRMIGMKQAGIERHEWISAKDDAVRLSHQIDGEDVVVGAQFSNGLTAPLDAEGEPEEIINCRCTTLPVVSEV